MSIPPLVCSTPPPPDQCEDDKDTEEYDLQYSLSQEDDESVDYGFNHFSTYNHSESPTVQTHSEVIDVKNKTEISKMLITENIVAVEPIGDNITETNNKCQEKSKYDDDINIEDLNLKLDDEPIDANLKDIRLEDKLSSLEPNDNSLSDNSVENSNITNNIDACDNVSFSSSLGKEQPSEVIENNEIESDFLVDDEEDAEPTKTVAANIDKPMEAVNDNDLDDFQFIRSDSKAIDVIETSDNPWESAEIDSSNFGDFTANFEDAKKISSDLYTQNRHIGNNNQANDQIDELSGESDFDDFDNFQSSVQNDIKITQDSEIMNSVHVFNIQTCNDKPLVMENINKLLYSIFDKEIRETEFENNVKLETLLNETWGYLIETDIRQPYIVNWNNSLGQKTLLRSLCIDSRNILFGPKWSHYMPKYAANLNVAPLQPQKQASIPIIVLKTDAENIEKPVSKSGTWMDPFTADGQEFTYAEALLLDLEHLMATLDQIAHNQSTLKISELLSHACNMEGERNNVERRPNDLDVFQSTKSSSSEKTYPNLLNIQPVRQINLPETHIFTPTDSETPRSQTTHFSCGPPVLMPQQVSDVQVIQTEENHSDLNKEDTKIEDEVWEFQGFKSTTNEIMLTHNALPPKSLCAEAPPLPLETLACQTQILQPIKIEPNMPTLNWPDPGEVKNDFEDFTDFVSSSTCSKKPPKKAQTEITTSNDTEKEITDINSKYENKTKDELIGPKKDNSTFDDDFDTFQSATKQKSDLLNAANSTTNPNSQVTLSSVSNYEQVIPKINNIKSESISFTNMTKFESSMSDLTIENSLLTGRPTHSNILQPTPVNTNVSFIPNQQKSGQILQPLSLESYSQINWPSPGIDLQDLSRFNPVDTLQSLKNESSTSSQSKNSPVHHNKNQVLDDEVWGEFVSSKPKQQQPIQTNMNQVYNDDDDEWTDFVSSSSITPQNGLNTISFNVHTNSNMQKNINKSNISKKNDQFPLDIPALNYITPKASNHKVYKERHFQNL